MFLNDRNKNAHRAIKSDSLIDILVSVVGFMIVLVLFTVITGRGNQIIREAKVTILAPILQQSNVNNVARVLVLCQGRRACILDMDAIIEEIDKTIQNCDRIRNGVKEFNRQKITKFGLQFRIKSYATPDSLIKRKNPRLLTLIISSIDPGERLKTLNSSESHVVSELNSDKYQSKWVHFLVDKQSVDIFRLLRSIALERGALVGWEPVEIKFPMEEPLTGVEDAPGFNLIRGFQQTR